MAAHLDLLRSEARSLPPSPGVYFWQDGRGRILYIGKAVNLRARVGSYFSTARRNRRTRELLERSRHITFEVTESELEALFRESALIKQEQPPYNRALRSPRRLYYLTLDRRHMDPYLEIVAGSKEDGSRYFGPFPSRALARETMAFLHDILPLRKCTAAKPRCRPCVYFQMGKCSAPLIDGEHREKHEEAIRRLDDLLQGRSDRVAEWLERKRNRLSASLLFEQAAEIQVRLDLLNDHRRQHAILEAAVQSRCVIVRDRDRNGEPRALLVAHGHVLSVRPLLGVPAEHLARWIKLHEKVVEAARYEQNELDAASVLERWLHCRHESAWVAIPPDASNGDLLDRARYIVDRRPVITAEH